MRRGLRITGIVLIIIGLTILLGAVLEILLGDTGKVLYGAACFISGYWGIPWATSDDRKWMA